MQAAVAIVSTGGDVIQGLSGFPKKSVLWEEMCQPSQRKMKQNDVATSGLLKHTLSFVFKNKLKTGLNSWAI